MNAYDIITERIISKLEAGVAPWRQTWGGGGPNPVGLHKNLDSGKPYRGINAFLTALAGYRTPYWATYKQATAIGAHVRQGEKGTPIVFFATLEKEDPRVKGGVRKVPMLRYYTAFNLEQLDGLSPKLLELTAPPPVPAGFDPIPACDAIVGGMPSKPRIVHAEPRAYYRPASDLVNMPAPESFGAPAEYYATLFHELGHATGHESRLDRDTLRKVNAFGDHSYSKEELVAEMTAAFLCGHAGIDSPALTENQAAYLDNWIRVLRGDSKLIVQAAGQAQKAADFILGKADDTERAPQ